MKNRGPSDIPMLQRTGYDSLGSEDRRLYLQIQKRLRDHPYLQQSFDSREMERVYDALNTDDPLFYVPNYHPGEEDTFLYVPSSVCADRYGFFLRDIWEVLEDDPEDLAGYLNGRISIVTDIFNKYSLFLKDYCLAKAIQYMCNLYGIKCELFRGEDGAMYVGYIMGTDGRREEKKTSDPFGMKKAVSRLDEVTAPVIRYLESRGYEYTVKSVVPFERILKVTDENVLLQFRYLAIFDRFIIDAHITPRYREKFKGELEKRYHFEPSKLQGALCWETEFELSMGEDALMDKLYPFLPEGGLPEEISDQLEEFKNKLRKAEESYERGDLFELAVLRDETLEELMKLDDLCESIGLGQEFVGKAPGEFYDLVMKIEGLPDDDNE
ncbi:MAG: hypothetical protein II464_09090 [Oscillospiraceae bacterium]|nr:hypothetical protein [Oscillospiraceae bacterium]